MKDFEAFVQKTTGKSFTEISDSERQAIVAELDRTKSQMRTAFHFFTIPPKN